MIIESHANTNHAKQKAQKMINISSQISYADRMFWFWHISTWKWTTN